MEILSPVWPITTAPRPAKTRPQKLEGTRIAFVADNLDTPFTTHLEGLLAERAAAEVRRLVKPSGTAPSPPTLIEEAVNGADVAIVGVGL